MNYETIKSFILVVLVGASFLLSFILWSYQPNYDSFYDTSYVNEVDIGGMEKTKNELVEPIEIIFRNGELTTSFIHPNDRRAFYNDLASWDFYEYRVSDASGRPDDSTKYVELIFPGAIPASLITSIFTFHDEMTPPNWSFERMFLTLDESEQFIELIILSRDERKQITATIEKSETYDELVLYMNDEEKTQEYIRFGPEDKPIYLPKDSLTLSSKTLISSSIEPERFINALFSNPSLVTQNNREAYFTDGQRGMRILQDGRRLEYINPIQSSDELIDPAELIDRSVNNINEHKGWTNDFLFEDMNMAANHIRYRLYYDGYPVFDQGSLSIIDQGFREQELYQYTRPLIQLGNVLNSREVELPSGREISDSLKNDDSFTLENVDDIQVGYTLHFIEEAHSLTLEPSWYVLYQGDWVKINDLQAKGGD